jgi:hypothetical protein
MSHHSINKGLAIACLLSLFVLTFVASAHRQDFRVTEAFLKADDARMNGPCPLKVVFHGSITTDGPGTVKYTFTRSDGASGPAYAMEFKEAGTQGVSTDWTLGDAIALPRYDGWQSLKILSPNEMESSQKTGSFSITCGQQQPNAQQPADNQQAKGTETTQQPGEKISPVVMAGLRWGEEDSAARAEARRRAFEADRARFEPTATALADALKAAGVDLDGYLAASKQFVETPPGKTSQVDVDRVNQKFAEPIRAAIARAVGVPGVGDLLQSVQWEVAPGALAPGKQNHRSSSGNSNGGPQTAASCCSTNRFEPPFEGLSTEGELGARSIRPGETRQLSPRVRSAIASAPHTRQGSGRGFRVPAATRHVSVTVNLGTSWVIGLSGLGYAHVWLGLDMNVTNARGGVVCGAPHLEQDNRWTWAGGFLTLSDHRPGPSITRTCVFDRSTSDPTDYAANVSASTDGTFIGFSGGYGDYYVDLGPVDVTTCP